MAAVSKAQQRFMGMVHAADKGETPSSPEVAKVSANMKDSDAKDFASTKHAGLPDRIKQEIKNIVKEIIREKAGISEMNVNDVHYKNIMKMYDRGGSFTKKKVSVVVTKNPNSSRSKIQTELDDAGYEDILEFEDELGLAEIREKCKSVIENSSELPKATIPSAIEMKLAQTIAKITDSKLSPIQKLQILAKLVDGLGIDKSQLSNITNKIRSKMESVSEVVNEELSVEAYKISRMIGSAQQTTQDFIDDNKIDVKKLELYIRNLSIDKKYIIRDIINGSIDKRLTNIKKMFIKQVKESVNEEHDCGCNENHDCGCSGVHEHTYMHEDLSADANGIAGLTASRASAVEDFLEKNNINSNKLYLFLKKGGLKDRLDFVTALVGKAGNPIQKKVISQFSN